MIALRALLALVLMAAAGYAFLPVIDPGFVGVWAVVFLGAGSFVLTSHERGFVRHTAVWSAALVLAVVVGVCTTWSAFHATAYRDLLGAENDGAFDTHLPPIDVHQPPLVSADMARRSAEKRLSEVPALGSQVTVGAFQKQLVKGRLYWVAFLEHRSITRWWTTGATPGYVRVSAVDPTDVELVTRLGGGEELKLRYLPSAWFGDNLERHLYANGFASVGADVYTAEIDEEGRPFYVVTLYTHRVGLGGADALGVVTVDVQTGAIARYALDETPAWVDIVHPDSFVAEQIAHRGTLVHGWFNPSDKDRLRVSGEPDLIYGADGRAYWYVGLTSTGNDAGLVGFYLVDSRTKAVRRYALAGITEAGAQHAAEGVLPEKGYQATNPLPFSVNGRPTYVMTLRDGTGIARAYAFVNIETFQTLAVADTLQSALRQYEAALSRSRTTADVAATAHERLVVGTVDRIGSEVRQGNTLYYMTVRGEPRVFVAAGDLSEHLALTRPADEIRIQVDGANSAAIVTVTKFENASVTGQSGAAETGAPRRLP